jgi:hypothetical protein
LRINWLIVGIARPYLKFIKSGFFLKQMLEKGQNCILLKPYCQLYLIS